MTLGNAAAARVRLIVWCRECQHQVEPDPAEMEGLGYSAETTVLDWRERFVRSRCGGRQADMVVTGPGDNRLEAAPWTQLWTQTPHYGPRRDGTRSPFAPF
jgi:hypothetical protein